MTPEYRQSRNACVRILHTHSAVCIATDGRDWCFNILRQACPFLTSLLLTHSLRPFSPAQLALAHPLTWTTYSSSQATLSLHPSAPLATYGEGSESGGCSLDHIPSVNVYTDNNTYTYTHSLTHTRPRTRRQEVHYRLVWPANSGKIWTVSTPG